MNTPEQWTTGYLDDAADPDRPVVLVKVAAAEGVSAWDIAAKVYSFDRKERERRARLIAAAPDLLAALRRVLQLAVSAGGDEIFAEVLAAIAKATGANQ